jgi:DNA-binding HxlR family transcriptional regulator
MYERKIAEDLECGITVARKVFGSKWKPCIIDSVSKGYVRPTQLHKVVCDAAARVIDIQIKELVDFGVLEKKCSPGFPLKVEYSLTVFGESILPILNLMEEWGNNNKEYVKQIVNAQNASVK